MDILYFLDSFPKLSKSFVLNEIRALERLGHDIAVFSLDDPGEEITHTEFADIEAPIAYANKPSINALFNSLVDRRTLSSATVSGIEPTYPQSAVSTPFLANQCLRYLADIDFEPDIVHGHFLNWRRLGAVTVAEHLDVPCTVTTHAYDLYRDNSPAQLRRMSNKFDAVVTISKYNRRFLRTTVNTDTPISVIHAGINPEKFAVASDVIPYRLLTVARLTEKKGLEYAIRAVGRVADEYPDLEYHIVGSGERRAELQALTKSVNAESVVKFFGSVSDERLLREYAEADIFLLPSVIAQNGDRDGIPVVLMEAMLAETVPVSTTVSGIPELISDGENGILVPPKSVNDLSESLNKLCQDDTFRQYLRGRAPEIVEKEFNSYKNTKRLTNLFHGLS